MAMGQFRSRVVALWLLFLAAWHSLDVANPGRWRISELQRDLRALVATTTETQNQAFLQAHLTEDNPVHCYNETYCCGIWNVSGSDHWWTHNPDWEVSFEDETSFCFAPMQNETKRAFLKDLHWLQWQVGIGSIRDTQALEALLPRDFNFTVNCSDMRSSVSIGSGYGAAIQWLLSSFWEAWSSQKPFQTIDKWLWMYTVSGEKNTWANCTEQDQSCFYLPISPCSREFKDQPRFQRRPDKRDQKQVIQWLWLKEYFLRPQQFLRQQLYKLRQPFEEQLSNGCVAMHIRRGDSGTLKPPYRRYAAVQEYLDLLPDLQSNTTIFLLTDDASTIEEVQRHHISKHRWVYTDKARVRGVENGFDGHVPPSSSGPDELAIITAEQELASKHCDSFVFGRSGYAYTLLEQMRSTGRQINTYYLETRVDSSEVQFIHNQDKRVANLMQMVANQYEPATAAPAGGLSRQRDSSTEPPESSVAASEAQKDNDGEAKSPETRVTTEAGVAAQAMAGCMFFGCEQQ
ncbi:expressed unknown protein [Seminavis robusta]|uniref:Uncharacterized protein n=1 Tax=Seminavis robusta TaxID=568900 RepID=A0A9N8E3X3_9STRA|nr:expressed unknown protein [Seminavis robusta]|eukprot:Sro635_g179080.1 n/a (516) ;mRNA; f:14410-16053